jgi:hypothetical protein
MKSGRGFCCCPASEPDRGDRLAVVAGAHAARLEYAQADRVIEDRARVFEALNVGAERGAQNGAFCSQIEIWSMSAPRLRVRASSVAAEAAAATL